MNRRMDLQAPHGEPRQSLEVSRSEAAYCWTEPVLAANLRSEQGEGVLLRIVDVDRLPRRRHERLASRADRAFQVANAKCAPSGGKPATVTTIGADGHVVSGPLVSVGPTRIDEGLSHDGVGRWPGGKTRTSPAKGLRETMRRWFTTLLHGAAPGRMRWIRWTTSRTRRWRGGVGTPETAIAVCPY